MTQTQLAWLDAAEQSLIDVAMTALGTPDGQVLERTDRPRPNLGGGYIQLLSDNEAVQVGLCASEADLKWLASALMREPGELTHADVADAIGEIVNITAGGVKRRLASEKSGLQLGLPIFIQGHLEATEGQKLFVSRVQLAGREVALVVLCGRRGARSA